jgi:hypothetical protein
MKKYAPGGYMTPEDVEEEKAAKKAGKAYDKAMPEADASFGQLKISSRHEGVPAPISKERSEFDEDIKRAKEGLAMEKGDDTVYSKERGLGPGMAAKRLEKRGVDIPGLVGKRVRNESVGMKTGGKVSASSRADGCAERGKTRGKII